MADNRPHTLALIAAIHSATRSPCAKSHRGVAAFNSKHRPEITGPTAAEGYMYSCASNRPPLGCDGSEACRRTCGKRCIHAEAAAMLAMPEQAKRVDLVHVKARADLPNTWACHTGLMTPTEQLDALIEPSGPPSCMQCAVMIAADPRVEAIWLLHRDDVTPALFSFGPGWHRWLADDFLRETMAQCGIGPGNGQGT